MLSEIKGRVQSAYSELTTPQRPQESKPEYYKPKFRAVEDAFWGDLNPFAHYFAQVHRGHVTMYREVANDRDFTDGKSLKVAITHQGPAIRRRNQSIGFEAELKRDCTIEIPEDILNEHDIRDGDWVQIDLVYNPQFD